MTGVFNQNVLVKLKKKKIFIFHVKNDFLLGGKPFHTIIHFDILQICFFQFETATQYITVYLHHDHLSEK
jgi:hypothetical protein